MLCKLDKFAVRSSDVSELCCSKLREIGLGHISPELTRMNRLAYVYIESQHGILSSGPLQGCDSRRQLVLWDYPLLRRRRLRLGMSSLAMISRSLALNRLNGLLCLAVLSSLSLRDIASASL